ncbi:hypothetical protein FBZ99_10815 [Rhizobium sp. ERR 1071]|uniref:hypothetical protein n=1 Tax=Rhizobium TaxID=379 RepID=UPI00119B3179|nr:MULTISPECIES: hypothetical protein [Rhizobium]TWB11635.1 hypothetical protein FBZ99_10815 [Rhizobium sp. ERR1071]
MMLKLKQICDIYLASSVGGDHGCLQGLNLFTIAGFIDRQKVYREYLRVDLQRLHAVSTVTCLRQSNIVSFSVPIEYRDSENIPQEKARAIAADFLKDSDEQLTHSAATELCPPVFWAFQISKRAVDPDVEERVGSKHIYIDRIDGRIWSYQEVLEYNYDYNNLL